MIKTKFKDILLVITMVFSLASNIYSFYCGQTNLKQCQDRIEKLEEQNIRLQENLSLDQTKAETLMNKMNNFLEKVSGNSSVLDCKESISKGALHSKLDSSIETLKLLQENETAAKIITETEPSNAIYYVLIGITYTAVIIIGYYFIIKPLYDPTDAFYDNIRNLFFGNNNDNDSTSSSDTGNVAESPVHSPESPMEELDSPNTILREALEEFFGK